MQLSNLDSPIISYWTWFFNGGGDGNPDDSLTVEISNGTERVLLETIKEPRQEWVFSAFNLKEFIYVY